MNEHQGCIRGHQGASGAALLLLPHADLVEYADYTGLTHAANVIARQLVLGAPISPIDWSISLGRAQALWNHIFDLNTDGEVWLDFDAQSFQWCDLNANGALDRPPIAREAIDDSGGRRCPSPLPGASGRAISAIKAPLPAGAGVSEREVLDKDGDDVPDWLPWDVRPNEANGDPERRAVQAGDGFFAWGNQDARINRHDWGAPGWNHCTPGVPVD